MRSRVRNKNPVVHGIENLPESVVDSRERMTIVLKHLVAKNLVHDTTPLLRRAGRVSADHYCM
jgi:hypothetical protein